MASGHRSMRACGVALCLGIVLGALAAASCQGQSTSEILVPTPSIRSTRQGPETSATASVPVASTPTPEPTTTATASPTATLQPSALLMQTMIPDAGSLEWSPKGDTIAVTNTQGVVFLNASDLTFTDQLEVERGGGMLSFSPSGEYLAATNTLGGDLLLIEMDGSPHVTASRQFMNGLVALQYASDQLVYAGIYHPTGIVGIGGFDHSLQPHGGPGGNIEYEFDTNPIAISPKGDRAAIGVLGGGTEIYGSGQDEPLLTIDNPPVEMQFTPDGRDLVILGVSCVGSVVRVGDGQLLASFRWCSPSQTGSVIGHGLVVGAAGRYAAASDYASTVNVWEVASGDQVTSFTIPQRLFNSLSFSPDSSKLASIGEDGMLQIWSLKR